MTLGDKLKSLRENLDLRQIEVASQLNILQATLSNYEVNAREPDYATLVQLANFYNVNIDYLLGNTSIKSSWKDIEKTVSIDGEDFSSSQITDMLIHLPERDKKYIVSLLKLLNEYNKK